MGGERNARRGLPRGARLGTTPDVIVPRPFRPLRDRLRATALAIFVSAASAATAAPLPAHLTIASEGARPPYNYLVGDTLEGFEIDLGRDLCRRMAVTCSFVEQDWDSMIPDLLEHRYDAIMAAMEVTPAREARIAFSTPYVRMPSAFLVRRGDSLTGSNPEALAGKSIGVEAGGTHQAFVEKLYPRSRLRRFNSLDDAILDLEAGRVDAALGDKDAVVRFMETRGDATCCRILADVPRDPAFFGAGIGIGLRKDDVTLKDAFDKALAASVADGGFERIRARYFDFPIR